MELLQEESGFTLGQEAYVSNLVRLHGLDPDSTAGLPCPKEWIQDDHGEAEAENYNDEELNKAQRITGECLWLAYRTRPDILFATNYMASMTSRRPVKVFQVGLKVLAYLNTTSALKLKVESPAEFTKAEFTKAEFTKAEFTKAEFTKAEFTKTEAAQATAEATQATAEATQATAETTQAAAETTQAAAETTQAAAETTQAAAETTQALDLAASKQHEAGFRVGLSGYCDASFAPYSGKSFGCSLVMLGKTLISRKAGRQPMVAMSVCEAELMEGSTCALLLESTQAMLREIIPDLGPPSMYIDNMAAHNILNGASGSWRTRHLRIRRSYVLDRIAGGHLKVEHISGEDQPADLPTKLHSKARLLHLLGTWNMVGIGGLDVQKSVQCLKLGCLFLLLLAVQSLAVAAEKEPLKVTGTLELMGFGLLTCIAAVAVWEAGKAFYRWLVPNVIGSKRSRRIQKLRELARAAAEADIEKWVEQDVPIGTDQVARTLRGVLQEERSTLPTQPAVSEAGTPDRPARPRSPLGEWGTQGGVWDRPHRRTKVLGGGRPSVFGGDRPTTPPIPRRRSTSPTPSPVRDDQGQFERERVVTDTLGLLTVKNLKIGLEAEGRRYQASRRTW